MRNLLLTILSLLLLAACTNTAPRTKHSALTKADSLMHTHPDSALALLQSISADSLTDDANRAYPGCGFAGHLPAGEQPLPRHGAHGHAGQGCGVHPLADRHHLGAEPDDQPDRCPAL